MRLSSSALSLATLALGAALAGPAFARTFVYVSNAQDANIDAYLLDKGSGVLTPIGKTDAGKLVMPMITPQIRKNISADLDRLKRNLEQGG